MYHPKMETHIKENNSYLTTIDNFLSKEESDKLFEYCKKLDLIVEPKVRTGTCHRCVQFYSDVSEGYYFAGQLMRSVKLTDTLKDVLNKVIEKSKELDPKVPPNSVLINYYRDGNDSIGSHSDSEKNLNGKLIIALSLGGPRKFRIRRKNGETLGGGNFMDVWTGHGQLLIMGGDFQDHFKHEVPVEKTNPNPERCSLTFRNHLK